jgi:hypothetical protein
MAFTDTIIMAADAIELQQIAKPLWDNPNHKLSPEEEARTQEILKSWGLNEIKSEYIQAELLLIFERLADANWDILTPDSMADMIIHYAPRVIWSGCGNPQALLGVLSGFLGHERSTIETEDKDYVLKAAEIAIQKAQSNAQLVQNWVKHLNYLSASRVNITEYLDTYYDEDQIPPDWWPSLFEWDEQEKNADTEHRANGAVS